MKLGATPIHLPFGTTVQNDNGTVSGTVVPAPYGLSHGGSGQAWIRWIEPSDYNPTSGPDGWDYVAHLESISDLRIVELKSVPEWSIDPAKVPMFSAEWFDHCFTKATTGEPVDVPADIREAAERIISAYHLRGMADPMYVANVIARAIGRGDGESSFTDNQGERGSDRHV